MLLEPQGGERNRGTRWQRDQRPLPAVPHPSQVAQPPEFQSFRFGLTTPVSKISIKVMLFIRRSEAWQRG